MAETHRRDKRWFNYPPKRELRVPYTEPKAEGNPVLRGQVLQLAATVVSSFKFLQQLLWNNAGFPVLRDIPELDEYEPWHLPTVIPLSENDSDGSPKPDYTDAESLEWLSPEAREAGCYTSVLDFHAAYRSGKLTPTAVVQTLLPLIRRDGGQRSDHSIAFVDIRDDLALEAAEASTKRYKDGKPLGVLDGVPVGVKDEVHVKGYKLRFGSAIEVTPVEDETAWCVKMWEKEGAVVMGKLNMHELGSDIVTNNPVHGTPHNPHNRDYYCGGSSGGSGYAVAAGLVPFALGTDAGGSIRIPASFCGLYGLKTTHGRVSGGPHANAAPTTDVIGPLAANMVDLDVAYRVMAIPDPLHPQSAHFPYSAPAGLSRSQARQSGRKKVIGIFKPWFDRADEGVRAACQSAVTALCDGGGYKQVEISLPFANEARSAHAMTVMTELATLPKALRRQRARLTAQNRLLISVAERTSAVDYQRAQQMRSALMQHLAHLFAAHGSDLIILAPTTPVAGVPIGRPVDLEHGISDSNTTLRVMEQVWLANFTGLPAITAPVAYVEPEKGDGKLPVGLMGMAEWGGEENLLAFGRDIENWLNSNPAADGRKLPTNWLDLLTEAQGRMQ